MNVAQPLSPLHPSQSQLHPQDGPAATSVKSSWVPSSPTPPARPSHPPASMYLCLCLSPSFYISPFLSLFLFLFPLPIYLTPVTLITDTLSPTHFSHHCIHHHNWYISHSPNWHFSHSHLALLTISQLALLTLSQWAHCIRNRHSSHPHSRHSSPHPTLLPQKMPPCHRHL